jgi:pilus assembly protein Flp/PilA
MLTALKRLVKEEQGQGMAEYGLILALVAVVVIGALVFLGPAIAEKFRGVTETLEKSPEDLMNEAGGGE